VRGVEANVAASCARRLRWCASKRTSRRHARAAYASARRRANVAADTLVVRGVEANVAADTLVVRAPLTLVRGVEANVAADSSSCVRR
jgi:hypothetical protein